MMYGRIIGNDGKSFTEVERRKFVSTMLHVQMELAKLAELTGNGDLQSDICHVINTLENMNDTYAGCKNRLASAVYDMKLIHMYKPELSNAELAEEVGLEESTVKKYLEEK